MLSVPRKRAFAAALVVPLMTFGVSACGGDEEAPEISDSSDIRGGETPGSDATATPTDGETAAPEGTPVDDPAAVFDTIQTAMRKAKTARVAITNAGGNASGVMSFAGGEPNLELAIGGEGSTPAMQMRFVDGVIYVSMPGVTPEGKFFRFDEESKTLGGQIAAMRDLTPDASAEMMAKTLKTMSEVGEEDIEGEKTTHYHLVIDAKKAQELAGQPADPSLPETVDFEMWVTEDNLIRRIAQGGSTGTQMDYTNWGDPVSVEAPPAADVLEAPAGL